MSATTIGMVLDEAHARAIADLRGDLATAIGEVAAPVSPHLTLAVVQGLEPRAMDRAIADTAAMVRPLSARVRGVAIVHRLGDGPVVYLPVVRTAELDRCHRELLRRLAPARIEGHYRADTWIPHVTVWRGPLSPASLELVAERMAAIAWSVPLTALSRLDDAGVRSSFRLGVDEDGLGPAVGTALDAVGRPLGWDLSVQPRSRSRSASASGSSGSSRSPDSAAEA
jgi:2'-5' RNA ligase